MSSTSNMSKYLEKPIIFVGFPRSGTTIISEVIMQHHKLAWISQYQDKFPKSTHINYVRNLFQNKLWKIKGQKNQLNRVPLLNKYIFRPDEAYIFWNKITKKNFAKSFLCKARERPERVKQIRFFFEKIVKYQNRERLAFKVTGPARLMYLHSIFPDAHFINIKRDPLPTIRSLLKVNFWNEQEGKDGLWWRGKNVYSFHEKKKIEQWNEDNKPAYIAALQYYKVHDIYRKEKKNLNTQDRVINVSYEDFTQKPKKNINIILNAVNLEWDKNITTYFDNNSIYNRNVKEEYYISPDLDSNILEIAVNGIV